MNILITGASGFVGRALAQHLAAHGHQLTLQVRRDQSSAFGQVLVTPPIESITQASWRDHLAGVDAVIHTAAIAHIGADVLEERYQAVNRDAAARLAQAAAARGIERFVFISSIRAQVGPSSPVVQNELTHPAPTEAYGRSKLEAEHLISAALPAAIHLRPPLVIGEGAKGNLAAMLMVADTPFPLPFAAFSAGQAMVARDNLISAITLALTNHAMRGETYVLADDPHPSLADMLAWMREGMGRPRRLFALPQAALHLPLVLMGRRQAFARLTDGLVIDSAKARTAGWMPQVTPADCFRALGRVYRALNEAGKQA
jgi:nucleoside-diphosphate-sugar epimerase